jgi:hypothetical protein
MFFVTLRLSPMCKIFFIGLNTIPFFAGLIYRKPLLLPTQAYDDDLEAVILFKRLLLLFGL